MNPVSPRALELLGTTANHFNCLTPPISSLGIHTIKCPSGWAILKIIRSIILVFIFINICFYWTFRGRCLILLLAIDEIYNAGREHFLVPRLCPYLIIFSFRYLFVTKGRIQSSSLAQNINREAMLAILRFISLTMFIFVGKYPSERSVLRVAQRVM